jgi:flagellar M-ring protein FliF
MSDPTPSPGGAQGPAQLLAQLRELWSRQNKQRRLIAIAVVVGLLGAVGYLTFGRAAEGWSGIGQGAEAEEITNALQQRGIPTRMTDDKVEVPEDRAAEARGILLAAGLPKSGKGFELFDKSSLGQSSMQETINFQRALQGELERQIQSLTQVERAHVLIAFGKQSPFKDNEVAPSASVQLTLRGAQQLSAEQVRGVRMIVANAIPGLKSDGVVIIDNHGNPLDAGELTAADQKSKTENDTNKKVRDILGNIVGPSKISVVTTAEINLQKIEESSDVWDKENEAIRSQAKTVDGQDPSASSSGIAGVQGNLPNGGPAAGSAAGKPSGRLQETINYEPSHKVVRISHPDWSLTRLHVAVLVDYKTNADGKPVARSAKELEELKALVATGAGIDLKRGDVLEVRSIQFVPPDVVATVPPLGRKLPVLYLAIGGGLALLILGGIVFTVLRRRRRAATAAPHLALPAAVGDLERVLEARPGHESGGALAAAAVAAAALPPGKPIQERIIDVVRGDVERTAGVLTSWLSEHEHPHAAPSPAPTAAAKGAKS